MRIEEYDDGYDSKESFERAGCDTPESLEPPTHNDDPALALWFTPAAIRSHFDGDDDETAEWVANASDEELREIGEACLSADSLYGLFHMLLINAIDNAREVA